MNTLLKYDYKEIVVKLHDIARCLEQDKRNYTFAREVRNLADRLDRVVETRFREWTEEELSLMDYFNATPFEF